MVAVRGGESGGEWYGECGEQRVYLHFCQRNLAAGLGKLVDTVDIQPDKQEKIGYYLHQANS